jgi:hypothetical protein
MGTPFDVVGQHLQPNPRYFTNEIDGSHFLSTEPEAQATVVFPSLTLPAQRLLSASHQLTERRTTGKENIRKKILDASAFSSFSSPFELLFVKPEIR